MSCITCSRACVGIGDIDCWRTCFVAEAFFTTSSRDRSALVAGRLVVRSANSPWLWFTLVPGSLATRRNNSLVRTINRRGHCRADVQSDRGQQQALCIARDSSAAASNGELVVCPIRGIRRLRLHVKDGGGKRVELALLDLSESFFLYSVKHLSMPAEMSRRRLL